MAIKNNRDIALLKYLINHEGYVTSETICAKLGISDRTLRDDVSKCRTVFETHGIHITSKHGSGYQVEIRDEKKYYEYIQALLKEESLEQRLLPVYPEDRINYLIKLFLSRDDYIKIDDVADDIFVSRSTLSNDLKEVKERFKFFHLDMESKPAYGTRLMGSEFHRRSCIAQYFFHTQTMDDVFMEKGSMNEEQLQIRDILYQTMHEKNFRLTDIGFQNLIIHISIALLRIRENKLEDDHKNYVQLKQEHEYEIAVYLSDKLEQAFQIQLPEMEVYYITIHLLGKKNMQDNQHFMITQEIEQLLQTIFTLIKTQYQIDLSADLELYTLLAYHFQPMLHRLRYGLTIQNPLLQQIKKENGLAFEVAINAAKVIEDTCACTMDEAEIGYLALHFALAIERIHKQAPHKNIIIVCASGAGSSQILLYKIKQRFQNYLGTLKVSELYELPNIDQREFDFILSTVPINFSCQIPVIQVQYFLDGNDVAKVSEAFRKESETMSFVDAYFKDELFFDQLASRTREEVIHDMCKRIQILKRLPDDFEASVRERENFAVTEFGNAIAMPHPMHPMSEETFVAVGILAKAIRWQTQMVKYVFLLCIKKDSCEALGLLHESLSTLVMDKQAMNQLEKQPTLAQLKDILKQIAQQEKANDIDVLFS